MTEWIEFRHDWAYYITTDTFTMNKVTGKVPAGTIVLIKEKEILDNGVTITNTTYALAKDGHVVNLDDKRSASKILAKLFVDYMKKYNEYPPDTTFDKSFKNGSVDMLFKASDYDKFKIRLTHDLVGSDPEQFLMNLSKARRKNFNPENEWKIEPAKSNRSTCKTCGQKIEKNHLRLGEPSYFQDHLSYKWHHFACKADEIWGIPNNKLSGYVDLSSDYKNKVTKALWE
jgi:hypothetical protein